MLLHRSGGDLIALSNLAGVPQGLARNDYLIVNSSRMEVAGYSNNGELSGERVLMDKSAAMAAAAKPANTASIDVVKHKPAGFAVVPAASEVRMGDLEIRGIEFQTDSGVIPISIWSSITILKPVNPAVHHLACS